MKLWGGRFSKDQDESMKIFNNSFHFDQRLYAVDIQGSLAYADELRQIGLLTKDDFTKITKGLNTIKKEFDDGKFLPDSADEDIHTAVERRLTDIIGEAAGKLHTGRSRNDQVALDLRLYLMQAIDEINGTLSKLQHTIIEKAEEYEKIIMPGYTHLQPAQPVLFSHWLMNYFWVFDRDKARLHDCRSRTAVSPLGSGALAGNPFPIDRSRIAESLGMDGITMNSMDAVSDRDFVVEFLLAAAMIGLHISRLAEDLIIFSSPPYGYISIDETFTTGSSLMPQKQNPDSLELARGKSGRLISSLITLLVVLKGIPSTYNKDLQEDKEALFDSVDTLHITLPVISGVINTIVLHPENIEANLDEAMLATDMADYLVKKDVPFREAHHIIGEVVRLAEERKVQLSELPLLDLKKISIHFEENLADVFNFQQSVNNRNLPGGTAPEAVAQQIAQAKKRLK